tara:strand:+ start:487 stop:663 length:177 start_codon:yes stop_codon:yes gene_type:complete
MQRSLNHKSYFLISSKNKKASPVKVKLLKGFTTKPVSESLRKQHNFFIKIQLKAAVIS